MEYDIQVCIIKIKNFKFVFVNKNICVTPSGFQIQCSVLVFKVPLEKDTSERLDLVLI